jgi:hypothetical protein
MRCAYSTNNVTVCILVLTYLWAIHSTSWCPFKSINRMNRIAQSYIQEFLKVVFFFSRWKYIIAKFNPVFRISITLVHCYWFICSSSHRTQNTQQEHDTYESTSMGPVGAITVVLHTHDTISQVKVKVKVKSSQSQSQSQVKTHKKVKVKCIL